MFLIKLRVVKKNLRDEKLLVKESITVNRNLINLIKDKHSEILAIENKITHVTEILKRKKQEGLTPA